MRESNRQSTPTAPARVPRRLVGRDACVGRKRSVLPLVTLAILIARSAALQAASAEPALSVEAGSGQPLSQDALEQVRVGGVGSLARIVVNQAGYFMGTVLQPGSYEVQVRGRPLRAAILRLGTNGSREVASDPIWIGAPSDATPRAEIVPGVPERLRLWVGDIELSWTFLTVAAHKAAIGPVLSERTIGSVTIYADFRREDLAGLVDAAARAVKVNNTLLGMAKTRQVSLFLFKDLETYTRIDKLLTGGSFAKNWAFTSDLTGHAYLWYRPLELEGTTLWMEWQLLHEVGHIVATGFRVSRMWPWWLKEGLAELAAMQTLSLMAPAKGKALEQIFLGRWALAASAGWAPEQEDLLAGSAAIDPIAHHTLAYFLARELWVRDPAALCRLLWAVDSQNGDVNAALRFGLETQWPLDAIMATLRAFQPAVPGIELGHLEPRPGFHRVIALGGGLSRLVFPDEIADAAARVSFGFAYAEGAHEVHVYLGFREGRDARQYLRLSIGPTRDALEWFRHGRWYAIGERDSDAGLATKRWYKVSITYDGTRGTVELDIEGVRSASFKLRDYVPFRGGRVALGGRASIIDFTPPRVSRLSGREDVSGSDESGRSP